MTATRRDRSHGRVQYERISYAGEREDAKEADDQEHDSGMPRIPQRRAYQLLLGKIYLSKDYKTTQTNDDLKKGLRSSCNPGSCLNSHNVIAVTKPKNITRKIHTESQAMVPAGRNKAKAKTRTIAAICPTSAFALIPKRRSLT